MSVQPPEGGWDDEDHVVREVAADCGEKGSLKKTGSSGRRGVIQN